MNGLDVFEKLRPEHEHLDGATAERVWDRIVTSNPTLRPSSRATRDRSAPPAEVVVSQAPRAALTGSTDRSRHVALIGAAAAVVVGVVAIASLMNRQAADPSPGSATTVETPTSAPAESATPPPEASTTEPTQASTPLPPEGMRHPVAVLNVSAAGAAPARRSHFDEWVDSPLNGPRRYATRSVDNNEFEAVSWDVEPENEWHKSDRELPQVELVAGVDTRRDEMPLNDAVRYVFSRGERDRLTATVPAAREDELLGWLSAVASAPDVDSIDAPDGYEMLPPAYDPYTLYYPSLSNPDAVLTTINFGTDIAGRAWIEATHPGATIQALDSSPRLSGEAWAIAGADGATPTVVWQPRPQLIVELWVTSSERLLDYVGDLALLEDASQSGEVEYTTLAGEPQQPLPAAFDVVVEGETPIGRFYYYSYTTDDGQTCRAFYGSELGASFACATDDVWNSPPNAICQTGSVWDFTERTVSWALVDADQVDFVEIREHPDDAQPVTPNVEGGDFETQSWALVWASFDHPEPLDTTESPVTFTGGTCAPRDSGTPGFTAQSRWQAFMSQPGDQTTTLRTTRNATVDSQPGRSGAAAAVRF